MNVSANQHWRRSQHHGVRGFTLIELLLIMACCLVAVTILLPALARPHASNCRLSCVNNLKQVGLAFRTFALDNNDHYPAHVAAAAGGSKELAASFGPYVHFRVMSNELSTPKILICPDDPDPRRIAATTFTPGPFVASAQQIPFNSDLHVSYFASIDAEEEFPSTWLAGDRQIAIDGRSPNPGLVNVLTNSSVRWVKPPHQKKGNIAMADGSVLQPSNAELQKLVAKLEIPTNRLAMP